MKKAGNLKYHIEKQYIDRPLIIDIERKKNVVIYLNLDQELSIDRFRLDLLWMLHQNIYSLRKHHLITNVPP